MLPHLSVFRPSPNTISFTVSTAIPHRALSSHILHYFLVALRLVFGLLAILVLLAKSQYPRLPSVAHLSQLLVPYSWTVVAPTSLATLFLVFRRFHTEETLLTLRTLGIQTRSLSPSYLLPATTRFIPTYQIRDIFIHEAFRGFEVRYYLAVVVDGEADVVVVFPKILPNRAIVERVWREARECLYEPKGG